MNHHQLFTVLLLLGLWSFLIYSLLSLDDNINYLLIFNAIIIWAVFIKYYWTLRPKASLGNILVLWGLWSWVIIKNLVSIISLPDLLRLVYWVIIFVCLSILLCFIALSKTSLIYQKISAGVVLRNIFTSLWLFFVLSTWSYVYQTNALNTEGSWIQVASMIDSDLYNNPDLIPNDDNEILKETLLARYYWDLEVITYRTLIPILRDLYDGLFRSQNTSFSYIPKESVLYPSFSYWLEKWMIWAWIDPNLTVKCWNLFVLIWLAQWRDVQRSSETIVDDFWSEAISRWLLDRWCKTKTQVAVWSFAP